MRINKYLYLYVLQGWYQPYGWEDLTAEETWKDIKARRREYQENEPPTPYRIIRRREVNPAYIK